MMHTRRRFVERGCSQCGRRWSVVGGRWSSVIVGGDPPQRVRRNTSERCYAVMQFYARSLLAKVQTPFEAVSRCIAGRTETYIYRFQRPGRLSNGRCGLEDREDREKEREGKRKVKAGR